MDSVGQDFWQGVAGMVCFCFMILHPQLGCLEKPRVTWMTEDDSNGWELGQQGLEVPLLRWLLHSHVWNYGVLEGWALLRPSARITTLGFSSMVISGSSEDSHGRWLSSEWACQEWVLKGTRQKVHDHLWPGVTSVILCWLTYSKDFLYSRAGHRYHLLWEECQRIVSRLKQNCHSTFNTWASPSCDC